MPIPLLYKNKQAILYASGPSLTEEVVASIEPYKDNFVHIGCNNTYDRVPWLDVHYACDTKWWNIHGEDCRKSLGEVPSWTQCEQSAKRFSINFIHGEHKEGLSISPKYIHYGSNSGFQQLNIAFLMGVANVFLVGYDMRLVGGKAHYFGQHKEGLNRNSPYHQFVKAYETIKEPLKSRIYNCTLGSGVRCFKFISLREVLESSNL